MKKLLLLLVPILLLLVLLLSNKTVEPIFEPSVAGWVTFTPPPLDSTASRTIDTGTVVGFKDSYNTLAWLNIPYAAPPVGDLRWRAPRPANAWQGSRAANEYGAPCLQYWGMLAAVDGAAGEVVGSEDCLNLNIWAPENASRENQKPVMVWIHGGGNDSGTAKVYQAHHLAGGQDVVVVTINYRLGLIGWLSHEAIRATSDNPADASGNFGTLDIIAALRWVQKNIVEFGGDPNNVTIFGESAGGKNVYSMLASPMAKGLFHRAISQSGSADTTLLTLAEDFADKQNGSPISGLINSSNGLMLSILQRENPDASVADLKARLAAMPATELMAKMRGYDGPQLMRWASENLGEQDEMRVARIIRDGAVIPKSSLLTLFTSPDRYNSVPLLLGANRDEQKLFSSRDAEFVDFKFGVLPRIKDVKRYNRVSKYISDNWKAQAVDEPARVITANQGAPVYTYRFDWDDTTNNWLADLPTLIGAAHGLEISFVFGDFKGGVPLDRLVTADNADGRRALSKAMMNYWGEFAHSGSPGDGNGQNPIWPAWKEQGPNMMLLDEPNGGGVRMAKADTFVAEIKDRIPNDNILVSQDEQCEAYATLFLHGYMATDFWNPQEYASLGCEAYPAIKYRDG